MRARLPVVDIRCPNCGEQELLAGRRDGDLILLVCERCNHAWERDPSPACPTCGNRELRAVPLAILEKARGTQLSVIGTRTIHLCPNCNAETLERWHRNRPNPLMPDELPTIGRVDAEG